MQTDHYTTAVLTLIAIALVYLCAVQTVRPETVQAQQQFSVPVLQDAFGHQVVPVVEYKQGTGLRPSQEDPSGMAPVMQYVPAR